MIFKQVNLCINVDKRCYNQIKKKKDIIIIFIYGDINFEQKAIIQIIKIYTTVDSWSLHKYKCYL